ncbi:MAG TPA: hypothetical protein VHI10_14830 [Mycobacterium sp.]|nr:hypothetical protein [Mycobacterium sp.]
MAGAGAVGAVGDVVATEAVSAGDGCEMLEILIEASSEASVSRPDDEEVSSSSSSSVPDASSSLGSSSSFVDAVDSALAVPPVGSRVSLSSSPSEPADPETEDVDGVDDDPGLEDSELADEDSPESD